MQTSANIDALAPALSGFSAGKYAKDAANDFTKSRYVTLDALLSAVKAPLSEAGLMVTSWPDDVNGRAGLTTMLIHVESGQWMSSSVPFDGLSSVNKNAAQAFGSWMTYARRYAMSAILNLPGEKDDDGNSLASGKPKKQGDDWGGAMDEKKCIKKMESAKSVAEVKTIANSHHARAQAEGWGLTLKGTHDARVAEFEGS